MTVRRAGLLLGLALLVAAAGARAGEPVARFGLGLEVQADLPLDAAGRPQRSDEIELGFEAPLRRSWGLEGGLVVESESVGGLLPGPGSASIERLALAYSRGGRSARIGRLAPRFGMGWEVAAGIHGADLAERYEASPGWGLQAEWCFGTEAWGGHALAAHAFADGASEGFVLSLDGPGPGRLGEARYRASFAHGDIAGPAAGRLYGLSFGAEIPFRPGVGLRARAFAEHAELFGPGRVHLTSASLDLTRGRWHAALAFSAQAGDLPDAPGQQLLELSLGRRMTRDLDLQAGWYSVRGVEGGSHGLAVRLRWELGSG